METQGYVRLLKGPEVRHSGSRLAEVSAGEVSGSTAEFSASPYSLTTPSRIFSRSKRSDNREDGIRWLIILQAVGSKIVRVSARRPSDEPSFHRFIRCATKAVSYSFPLCEGTGVSRVPRFSCRTTSISRFNFSASNEGRRSASAWISSAARTFAAARQ
jgi:hypothetical protein